ncbi:hypothetical protein OG204_14035 [Streptomyces sp. NBC_01387]|uniref:hypothetical protein n=1 Tax=unclassified Streptomyces TaxID=2593676 RepID=UPI0020248DE0|nr:MULTISPECIES: hypothetical protein [unclassified Streptomyces]MCX4550646.1 hypothetical protein [Streptomyces sp. NBC_01500]WSC22090.1 hypothetical protein OIE60_21680 [Streptomyces sp. NBC_01766]WSV55938.1 hypothetical protein OG282_20775 [Streptomyces sp. NBC_01014]
MSTLSIALLLTTAAATAVGAASLYAAHGLRGQIAALRDDLAATSRGTRGATVPAARETPVAEIRAAVAEALAEERERELAEARAFWAAQESRDAADTPSLLGGLAGLGEDAAFFLPRQADFTGFESGLESGPDGGLDSALNDALLGRGFESPFAPELEPAVDAGIEADDEPGVDEYANDSAELAAARRRHPSHPDFVPVRTPVVTDHERMVTRLEELAETRTALSDVRPGPLGTLDVYVFADGTTLCMTPGHRETAERLAEALRAGDTPVLLGGSGISGAYALTFTCGEENVYILADRVIASL